MSFHGAETDDCEPILSAGQAGSRGPEDCKYSIFDVQACIRQSEVLQG